MVNGDADELARQEAERTVKKPQLIVALEKRRANVQATITKEIIAEDNDRRYEKTMPVNI